MLCLNQLKIVKHYFILYYQRIKEISSSKMMRIFIYSKQNCYNCFLKPSLPSPFHQLFKIWASVGILFHNIHFLNSFLVHGRVEFLKPNSEGLHHLSYLLDLKQIILTEWIEIISFYVIRSREVERCKLK